MPLKLNSRRAKIKREKVLKQNIQLFGEPICGICLKPVFQHEFSIDHIIPRCICHSDKTANLMLVHKECNLQKDKQKLIYS